MTLRKWMFLGLLCAAFAVPVWATVHAHEHDAAAMVGGAEMLPTRDIVANAALSADHTTLVAALKAAGLAETLKGKGPFTVLAPTNDAFKKLPEGTLANLLKPENKEKLASILTYHVIAGKFDAAELTKMVTDSRGGEIMVATLQGEELSIMQSNGVIHVIDTVLMPK